MSTIDITVSYYMSDGRLLECKYTETVTPGFTSGLPENCYPDEYETGEPEYFIDGELLSESELPSDIVDIASAMYEADDSDKRFTYKAKENYDGPDYDYD